MSATTQENLSGWGRTAPTLAHVLRPAAPEVVIDAGHDGGRGDVRPAGQGCPSPGGSVARYGDIAQNAGGMVIDMTSLNRVYGVNSATATATSMRASRWMHCSTSYFLTACGSPLPARAR